MFSENYTGSYLIILTLSTAHIDDPKPPGELPCTVYTYVRPLNKFPTGFEAKAKESKTSKLIPMKNERMLLNQLLGNSFLIVHYWMLVYAPRI